MTEAWFDATAVKTRLATFFDTKRKDFTQFGTTVNQAFEAFVFAQVVAWYRAQPKWSVELKHPARKTSGQDTLRLKFSTRGAPENYSYARCVAPTREVFQVRHQLRGATHSYKDGTTPRANVCLDVAVIRDINVRGMKSYMHVPNKDIVTFGEAKHMSAFAELVASFIGLVHEIQPTRLRRVRTTHFSGNGHPSPFLFVSGNLWATAEGLVETIRQRKYDIDIYSSSRLLAPQVQLHAPADRSAPKKPLPKATADAASKKPNKTATPKSVTKKRTAKKARAKKNV